MSYSLRQLIGYNAIMDIVTSPVGGVPTNLVIDRMMASTVPVAGDTAEWTVLANSRQTAPLNSPGNAARRIDQESISIRTEKCVTAFNEICHRQELIGALRQFDNPAAQTKASQVIDFQTQEFKRKHTNTRITSICSMLASGVIYVNVDGYILPSSSGAVRTIDFALPAQLVAGVAALPDGSTFPDWDAAGSDIVKCLSQLQIRSYQLTGRPIKYAIYGSAVPGYLQKNTNLINLINANPTVQNSFAGGNIPTGFGNDQITWINGSNMFYIDSAGTARYWLAVDSVIFLPEVDRSWFRMVEGTTHVPTSFGMFDDAPAAVSGGVAAANGMFGYCKIDDNPLALIQRMGDCFLPVPVDPNCVMRCDVKA